LIANIAKIANITALTRGRSRPVLDWPQLPGLAMLAMLALLAMLAMN
jgi:hypothetical protein